MKPIPRKKTYSILGWILSVPTACFIFIALMKFEFGWDYLYDRLQPTLESWGLRESIGWNINLLILFGPLLALLLNAFPVMKLTVWFTPEAIDCRVAITKSWLNLAVVAFSGLLLLFLGAYGIAEHLEPCQ